MSVFVGLRQASRIRPITAAAAALALIVGGVGALHPVAGLIALAGILFLVLAMYDVTFGLALWIPMLFVRPGIVTSAMGLGIGAAWVGSIISVRPPLREVLPGQRVLVGALVLLIAWMSLSLLWARDSHVVWSVLRGWLIAAAVLVVLATTITTPTRVRLVIVAFLAGALLSVAIGWVNGDGAGSHRFGGALQGPDDFAAQLLPVIVLAVALSGDRRRARERFALAAAVLALIVALVATQSRGGLVAAAVTIAVGCVIYTRHRRQVLLTAATVLAVLGVWFVLSPGARNHITSFSDGGAGRTTLWEVAIRMTDDRMPIGVGLGNFRIASQDYVREPGLLRYVGQIESPHVVHNTYLELVAETGIPGLTLFAVVVAACLASAWRAAKRFDHLDRHELARLSRGVILAVVSVLAAQLFQSNGHDIGLWILLALGPAMLAMSRVESLGRPRPMSVGRGRIALIAPRA